MGWKCVDGGDRWERALGDGRVLEVLIVGELVTWWLVEDGERREVSASTAKRLQRVRPVAAVGSGHAHE